VLTHMSNSAEILAGLNPEQKKAVEAKDGPLLVIAGAGSGKTSVLTRRIAYLIYQWRVAPWSILAITFTNKAAREMQHRIEQLIGPAAHDVWATTFHSMCARILRRDIEHLGYNSSFTVLDDGDQIATVRRIMRDKNIDTKRYEPRAILSAISSFKNELVTATKARDMAGNLYEKMVGDIYLEYERRLKLNQSLDFDDLIMKTVQLFREHPDVLSFYHNKFQYIHVDEYQDTNHAQYVLVRELAAKKRNLCAVGDSDQSIYGWRGADIQNILQFERDYPEAKVVRLEQNYRSTKTILEIANKVIEHNTERKAKNLWTEGEEGEKALICRCSDERIEANFIANQIETGLKNGQSYNDFSVLYRTNAQSRVIEEIFLQHNIPYRIFGGVRFYERKEIKDILSYLRLIANSADDASLIRVINVPKRGIGEGTIAKLQAFADMYGLTLFGALHQAKEAGISSRFVKSIAEFTEVIESLIQMRSFVTVTDLTEEILKRTGYRQALKAEKTLEAEARIENLDEFLSLTQEFDQGWTEGVSEAALTQFLTDVALIADSDLNRGKPDASTLEGKNEVAMMTLHSAKGLEFPVVFLAGMEEGIFPHSRSLTSDSEMEEERRLCYVGVTRAKKKLYMTTCATRMIFGEYRPYKPSRFFDEMPQSYVESMDASSYGQKRNTWSPRPDSSGRGAIIMPKSFGADLSLSYNPGDMVEHRKWGQGKIVAVAGSGEDLELSVQFDDPIGVRKLVAKFAPITKLS
jgi:DNA helicase II / ATP-dependent DNA helicase PcrA